MQWTGGQGKVGDERLDVVRVRMRKGQDEDRVKIGLKGQR